VFGGGIIPDADRQALAEMGVAEVFTPGATMSEIVSWVRANVGAARRDEEASIGTPIPDGAC
jgi:methylmalonyl-CoA mutase, C-terminal domain